MTSNAHGRKENVRRAARWSAVAVALALVVTGAPAAIMPATADDQGSNEVYSYVSKDSDRNRLYDQLDKELEELGEEDRIVVVVRMMTQPLDEDIAALKSAIGDFTILSNKEHSDDPEGKPWTLIPAFGAELSKAQIQELSGRTDVRQVANVPTLRVSLDTAKEPTGVNRARTTLVNGGLTGVDGSRDASSTSFSTDDVVICNIDSGIDPTHTAFAGGQIIRWKSWALGEPPEPEDPGGHGTATAGIAAGHGSPTYLGVAPGAALAVAQAFNATQVTQLDYLNVISALHWCADWKDASGNPIVDVINGSWGFIGTVLDPGEPDVCNDGIDEISDVVNAIVDTGIVAVFAAGNQGPGLCTVESPAAASKAIGVGMVGDPRNPDCSPQPFLGDGWYLHEGSARGSLQFGVYKPDILAPGVCVTAPVHNIPPQTPSNYGPSSGTSASSPFIAGVVALMLDAYPNLVKDHGAAKVKDLLRDNAVHWGPVERTPQPQSMDYGAGIVRADVSVLAACQLTNPSCSYSGSAPANPNHEPKEEDLAAAGNMDKWEFTTDAGNGNWPIAITLIIPGAGATKNFDLVLRRASDQQLIAQSAGVSRQETINHTLAGTQTYVIEVKSRDTIGGSGNYWLDLSAGLQAGTGLALTQDQ